jgi:hypothetical protein
MDEMIMMSSSENKNFILSLIGLILLIFVMLSCRSDEEHLQKQNFYEVVNYLLKSRFKNVSVVVAVTKPVYTTMWGEFDLKNLPDTEPPPPLIIYYDRSFFNKLIDKRLIDSLDASFMFHSINYTKRWKIDSSLISVPVISRREIYELLQGESQRVSNLVEKRYKLGCIAEFSSPVYNASRTKALISVHENCHQLESSSEILLLEKQGAKWKIIQTISRN